MYVTSSVSVSYQLSDNLRSISLNMLKIEIVSSSWQTILLRPSVGVLFPFQYFFFFPFAFLRLENYYTSKYGFYPPPPPFFPFAVLIIARLEAHSPLLTTVNQSENYSFAFSFAILRRFAFMLHKREKKKKKKQRKPCVCEGRAENVCVKLFHSLFRKTARGNVNKPSGYRAHVWNPPGTKNTFSVQYVRFIVYFCSFHRSAFHSRPI